MESNIINIATLTIDRKEANDSIVKTKQQIFELQKANADLRKDILKNGDATGEQTKKFVENEAELKQLTESYKKQQTAVNDLTLAQIKENKALTENAKSIEQATVQNKELLAIRNQVDASTKEGAQAIELLNDKMNKNKKFIVDNGTELEKASHIVGNYRQKLFDQNNVLGQVKQGFEEARTVVKGFSQIVGEGSKTVSNYATQAGQATKSMLGFKTSSQLAAESTNTQTVATEKASKGFEGLGKSFLTLSKVGILAVITGIIAVVTKLYDSFAPVKNVIDGVIASFKSLGESVMSVVKFISMADFSSAGDALSNMGDNATKAYRATVDLNKAIRELEASSAKLSVTLAVNAGKEKEMQLRFEDTTKSMDSRSQAMKGVIDLQKNQLTEVAKLAKQELGVEQRKLAIALNGRKLTKELLANDLTVATQFNELQRKRATLYTNEQELKLFNLQKSKKISDANVQIADDEFKIVTGGLKKQVELLDTKLHREGITSKEIGAIVAKEQQLKMQALGEYDRLFKKVTDNKIGANNLFDEQGFVRIGINLFDMAKKFQLSANQADRLRDMLGEYKDIDDRLMAGKALQTNVLKKEAEARTALAIKELSDRKITFETEKHTAEEQLAFYTKYYSDLNKIQGNTEAIKNAEEQSKKILEISTKTIDEEISLQQKAIEEKKRISQEEKNELIKNAQFLKEAENARIEQSLLNERDKVTAKLEIENGYRESLEAINATFKESEIARKEEEEALRVLEYENRLLTIEEQGYAESELRLKILEEEHTERLRLAQLDLDNGKITQAQLTQIKINEDKRYKLAKGVIDKEVSKTNRENQLRMLKDSIAVAQAIFGESKELSIATALINTFEGISAGVKLGFPLAIPAVALAATTGFKAVQNILNTDIGSGAGSSVQSSGATSAPTTATATATSTFENPARTSIIARADQQPTQATNTNGQPILILESLREAQSNLQVKIKSK